LQLLLLMLLPSWSPSHWHLPSARCNQLTAAHVSDVTHALAFWLFTSLEVIAGQSAQFSRLIRQALMGSENAFLCLAFCQFQVIRDVCTKRSRYLAVGILFLLAEHYLMCLSLVSKIVT